MTGRFTSGQMDTKCQVSATENERLGEKSKQRLQRWAGAAWQEQLMVT